MHRLLLVTGAALALAAPAFAGDFQVKTTKTHEQLRGIAADGAVWSCEGNTCNATLKRSKVSVRGCKKAARKLGELVSYGSGENKLTDEQIADCNKAAR